MKYFDLQVNGAFGVDFNEDSLDADRFDYVCERMQASGVVGFLPTIITESIETMCHRIHKIVGLIEARPQWQSLVQGIHIEGPFLSTQPGFFGTHPPQHLIKATERDAMRLLESGRGWVRLMTLAPEQDEDCGLVRRLHREKVIVFAGHTNASIEQLERSIDAGLQGFTHLGNGCVHLVERHDNIMQRVLALRDRLYVTLIADGIHLPGWLLSSWLSILGFDRSIVISDSISAAGMPPGEYSIGNQRILVEETRRTRHRDHGYLAGSASTMQDMDLLMQKTLPISDVDRRKIFVSNAASLLGFQEFENEPESHL